LASAPAKADVFEFRFGDDAKGTFTTGAAANDPGYELITSVTFSVLVDESDGFQYPKMTGQDFAPGAAFNPTTGAFINHLNGGDVHNIGDFRLVGSGDYFGLVPGASFEQFSTAIVVYFNGSPLVVAGPLRVTAAPAAAVPEASTWAMMLLGFVGLGFAARQPLWTSAGYPSSLKRIQTN
jgi:hypothetical protein